MRARNQSAQQPPGDNSPTKADAPATDRGAQPEQQDFAKTTTTALSRLALVGIEARFLHPDAWALIASTGATIGIVRGVEGLTKAATTFESARADVLALVQRLTSGGCL